MDVCVVLIILVISFIPMVLISILIKIDSPRTVLLRQKRLGKDGKVLLKFRSMCIGAEHTGSGGIQERAM